LSGANNCGPDRLVRISIYVCANYDLRAGRSGILGISLVLFDAIVGSRSSKPGSSGPPGEAEILRLNPKRRAAILAATGWADVFPGTLNLDSVPKESFESLLSVEPIIKEDAAEVIYPHPYTHIPRQRIGYLYFRAVIEAGQRSANVLVRRAINPPLRTRLEAFGETRLRDALAISDGDAIVCRIDLVRFS
jgi:hypothetical protein